MAIIDKSNDTRVYNFAKNIKNNPMGYFVVVLCIIIFFMYRDISECQSERDQITNDYLNTLKNIKIQLDIIDSSNTVKYDKH